MLNKVLKSLRNLTLGLALALGAPSSNALPLNLEMQQLIPATAPFGRDVYACTSCSLEQYDAIVVPAGWTKAPARVGVWSTAMIYDVANHPGVPLTAEFVAEIPGEEFQYVARVLSGQLLGLHPTLGFFATAQVERSTVQTYDAGSVVHELTAPDGSRYVLMTFDEALSETTFDLLAAGSLAGLALPTGWVYNSRVLTEALVNDSGGLAHVFNQGPVATYQRYSLPEPYLAWLLPAGLLFLARPRRWMPEGGPARPAEPRPTRRPRDSTASAAGPRSVRRSRGSAG